MKFVERYRLYFELLKTKPTNIYGISRTFFHCTYGKYHADFTYYIQTGKYSICVLEKCVDFGGLLGTILVIQLMRAMREERHLRYGKV